MTYQFNYEKDSITDSFIINAKDNKELWILAKAEMKKRKWIQKNMYYFKLGK